MNKFKLLIAVFLLLAAIASGQVSIDIFGKKPPSGTDTLYYPFYNDVQMIEIDHLGAWEANVNWHEQAHPRALSWSSLIPGPQPNEYLFRNKSGQIVKAFNSAKTPDQLTKEFQRIPIDKKSTGIHFLLGGFHGNKYFSGWGDSRSRRNYFNGYYKIYEHPLAFQIQGSFYGSLQPVSKVGLIDSFGNIFLPVDYMELIPLKDDILAVRDSACGVLNKKLEYVVPMKFERYDLESDESVVFLNANKIGAIYNVRRGTVKYIDNFDYIAFDGLRYARDNAGREDKSDLYEFRKDGKSGLVDTNYNVVVPAQYDLISWFSEGMALVCRDKKFGYLNREGKEVIPCRYTYGEYFRDGVGVVQHEGKFRNVDKKGKLLETNVREHAPWRSSGWAPSIGGLEAVQTNTGYGLVNARDVFVVPPIYQNLHPVRVTENGQSVFSKTIMEVRRFDKLGLIDTAGNVLVPFEYEMICEYHGAYEFRVVKKDEQHWGVINGSYDIVVPCVYDGIGIGYDQDYFTFYKNGKMGVMDTSGKILIPADYEQIYSFANGRALAVKDSLYGFIDRQGNALIPLQYELIHGDFVNGLTAFMQNEKWGFMDTTGAVVIQPQYEEVRRFETEITGVKLNGKWGFINRANKLVVEYKYEFVGHEWGHDKLIEVRRNGKLGFMDVNGNEVIPCIYDNQWGYGPEKGHFLEKDGVKMWVKPH